MSEKAKEPKSPGGKAARRADRLAAALRANLARRKAQARNRATQAPQKPDKPQ